LRKEEPHYLKCSTNYGDEIKDEEMGGKFRKRGRNAYKVLFGKPERKSPLE
jgi:hypothetical protein